MPTRENRAVCGPVRNLHTLGLTIEDHRMLTGDIAAAQHGKADIAFAPSTGLALADHIGNIIKRRAAPRAAASPSASAVPEGASTL